MFDFKKFIHMERECTKVGKDEDFVAVQPEQACNIQSSNSVVVVLVLVLVP
jgi:hypothetical protein